MFVEENIVSFDRNVSTLPYVILLIVAVFNSDRVEILTIPSGIESIKTYSCNWAYQIQRHSESGSV